MLPNLETCQNQDATISETESKTTYWNIETLNNILKHWNMHWNIETLKHIETTYWNFYCNREPFLFSVMMFLVVACFKIYVPNFCLFLIFLTFISLNASFDEACSSWQIKYRSNLSSLTYGTTSNLISDMQF